MKVIKTALAWSILVSPLAFMVWWCFQEPMILFLLLLAGATFVAVIAVEWALAHLKERSR